MDNPTNNNLWNDLIEASDDDLSFQVDEAYDRFCELREQGKTPDIEDFCSDYPPDCARLLRRTLEMDKLLGDCSRLLDDMPDAPQQEQPQEKEVEEDLFEGDIFRGYRIHRMLGKGTFATAYLAYDPEGERPVVLKVSRRATDEGKVLGKLDNEHIARMHWANYDAVSGLQVVCMAFAGSVTLSQVIKQLYPFGSTPPETGVALEEAIRVRTVPTDPRPIHQIAGPPLAGVSFAKAVKTLGCGLAKALAYLHERRMIHGDLKPSNVLIGENGQPQLLDFNLSQSDANNEQRGGTIPYMAPERLRAFMERRHLSVEELVAADVYSLGVILYQLLAGVHPFLEVTATPNEATRKQARKLLRLQDAGFVPLRQHNSQVPRGLARLIQRCLSIDPKARPKASDLVQALSRPKMPAVHTIASVAMVVVSLALVSLAFFVGPVWTTPKPAHVKAAVAKQKADALLTRGEVGQAKAQMAYACLLMNEMRGALAHGEEALRAEPSPVVRTNLASALMQTSQRTTRAEELLSQALKENPDLPQAYALRIRNAYQTAVRADEPLPTQVNTDLERLLELHRKNKLPLVRELCRLTASVYEYAAKSAEGEEQERLRRLVVQYRKALVNAPIDPNLYVAVP